jgi:hypothetical protein
MSLEMKNSKEQKELFYFMFTGAPLPDNPESIDVGGAYINCWVNENDYSVAESRARASIEAENWRIDELCEWMLCSEKYYLERNDLGNDELKEILNCLLDRRYI